MTEIVRGKTVAEIGRLAQRVHDLVTAAADAPVDDRDGLVALAGVRRFPVRAKCALLPWHTLHAAVHDRDTIVSTE